MVAGQKFNWRDNHDDVIRTVTPHVFRINTAGKLKHACATSSLLLKWPQYMIQFYSIRLVKTC